LGVFALSIRRTAEKHLFNQNMTARSRRVPGKRTLAVPAMSAFLSLTLTSTPTADEALAGDLVGDVPGEA
jgi:hypothetical protein